MYRSWQGKLFRRYEFVPIGELEDTHIFYRPSSKSFYLAATKKSSIKASQIGAAIGAFLLPPIIRVMIPDGTFSSTSLVFITMLLFAIPIALFFWFVVLRQWITLEQVDLSPKEIAFLMQKTAADRRRTAAILIIFLLVLLVAILVSLTTANTEITIGTGIFLGSLPFIFFGIWISLQRATLAKRVKH